MKHPTRSNRHPHRHTLTQHHQPYQRLLIPPTPLKLSDDDESASVRDGRHKKTIIIIYHDKPNTVSIDRVKPAYLMRQ
ncbi:hypothetical protein Pmani_001806 [Petrolisthes manimaculis]|uniref:Uncharacterized protein n=1 Tax=Petrolisthes manimaculis TaxID=1843537 RepID=A0AAE1P3X3_9EUCA|nr:hypothetical protein Pmani_027266 [Petrolisthes manimaculis]KAK4327738.1 hypothetical protein Pmani_001780 [Petrolisthes manimaculis]KAK4327764.1 hypothetical protein Pmani_001806 [Petrolisthes manimaculis]